MDVIIYIHTYIHSYIFTYTHIYIYIYGRWRLIMPGRVQEKPGGIGGSRELCFCWSCFFARWRRPMGSCKIQCGRLGLRFRSSRKAKQDLLHSTLLRLVRTPVLGERKLQRISSQRRDAFLVSGKTVFLNMTKKQ